MALSFFASLALSRRFGKAIRLQSKGALHEALTLLEQNRAKLASASARSVPAVSLRLMNLVHVAEVARALGRKELATSALEEWLSTWDAARTETPSLGGVGSLAKWENWVRQALASMR